MSRGYIFDIALLITQVSIILSFFVSFIRFVIGPHAQDRIVSFDMMYNLAMLLFISYAIDYQSQFYFQIALLIALLGFVASIAFAKFLMRGEVIE